MRRIIESGLLYTLAVIATFVTYVCRSNAIYVTSIAEMQILCIAFNLIIVRASKSRVDEYIMSSIATVAPLEMRMNHMSTTINGVSHVASGPVLVISRSSLSKANELEMECQNGFQDKS
ncbi:hypothetical protein BDQ17DRAFT_414904 [Cyathus striatus]|nr:hypothetical protein BDQ17DRAFT_414904 [Cyathus striatus]